MNADRIVRDGKVAVLVSPGFGAGWYTWGNEASMLFDPELVLAVEAGDRKLSQEIADRKWPDAHKGRMDDLVIRWLTEGTIFRVEEYDGSESILTGNDLVLTA